jgi:ubiquinone/menaquinone biosynthesis C-methylase UbiE
MNSEMIRAKAIQQGADLCGIAPISRFTGAPTGFHPCDVYPSCMSVIVFAAHFPLSAFQAKTNSPYTFVRNMMVNTLDRISFCLSDELEREGMVAVPIPSAEPYDYWDVDRKHGRGILSLKHAGVLAGLGIMGKNTLLINAKYGNMLWLGAILVSAELKPDPMASYQGCLPDCTVCLDECPQHALDGTTIDQKLCRTRSISCTDGGGWVLTCNLCRKVCPNHDGIKGAAHNIGQNKCLAYSKRRYPMIEQSVNTLFPHEILEHYGKAYDEANRLTTGGARLEFIRTQEIIERYFPAPPAVIYDIGGGPGAYSLWLAQKGYEVHLIDIVPWHIQLAQDASNKQPDHPLKSCSVQDARNLNVPDDTADVVLFMGPLYHLTDRDDRLKALTEALRILKSGGVAFCAAISRFASLLDGLKEGFLEDPEFEAIVKQDLQTGQHWNDTNNPAYFTTAFLHHPFELKTEIEAAGFQVLKLLGVEGPGWLLPNFEEHWADPAKRARLLAYMRAIEDETTLLGVSAHLMAVAKKSCDSQRS